MIYLVTNAKSLFPDESYKTVTISAVKEYLSHVRETALDIETTGLDPHLEEMLSLQVGDGDKQYVIDCSTVDIRELKDDLERITLLGQNLKFDLKFLYKKGIYPRRIWDTFVVEKVIHCGYPEVRCSLDSITERYLGFALDKSVRAEISKEGLTQRVIKYAADDVKYLPSIKIKQLEILAEKGLKGTVNLENRFTPVLAYIEYCGFKLDPERWLTKMSSDNARLAEAKRKLDQWVLDNQLVKYITPQLSMFEETSCKINWSSSKQLIQFFEDLGMSCSVVEKGVIKKSVEASVIEKYKDTYEIVKLYLEYKKAEKVVSTYGENFLKQINPKTKRIHTKFTQIMDTGRISSGGKDKAMKIDFINFQNIPSDPITRACFVAEPGNTLIVSDYSGQEQIVLANKSMDANLLKFYDEGLADMHSFVASQMYPELNGLDLEQIKKHHKDKRQNAKSAGFAINYGGVGKTIADNQGISVEEGNKIYDAYFRAFPGLRNYFDKVKKQGIRDGYILISPLTGRKCFLPFYTQYKALEAKTKEEGFWDKYRYAKQHQTPDFPELKKIVSEFFQRKGDMERMGLNYPIQGTSAEITKISGIYIFDWIVENNYCNIVKFANTVHDENVLEAPDTIAEEVAKIVGEYMCKAGDIYCKRVPLKAVPELTKYWKK